MPGSLDMGSTEAGTLEVCISYLHSCFLALELEDISSPIFQNLVSAYVKHRSSLSTTVAEEEPLVRSGCARIPTTFPRTIMWSPTLTLCGRYSHLKMNGKSIIDSFGFFKLRTGGSPVSSRGCCCCCCWFGSPGSGEENLKDLSSSFRGKFSFPPEKRRARVAVDSVGERRWIRNWEEERMAFRVSEGTLTLKETIGSGVRVTVLNEDTVMPRNAVSRGELGSVDVIIATGCGTRRIRVRMRVWMFSSCWGEGVWNSSAVALTPVVRVRLRDLDIRPFSWDSIRLFLDLCEGAWVAGEDRANR